MLLIDTYNVLHTVGVLPPSLAGLEVEGLVRLLARSRYGARPARLVCDGARPVTAKFAHGIVGRAVAVREERSRGWSARVQREWIGQAEIVYSGHGREADALIEDILQHDTAARRMLVVSSDRRVRRAAASARAESIESAAFLGQLAADDERRRVDPLPEFTGAIPLDPYSVQHWMREFGVEPNSADAPAPARPMRPAPQIPPAAPRSPSPAAGQAPSAPTTQPSQRTPPPSRHAPHVQTPTPPPAKGKTQPQPPLIPQVPTAPPPAPSPESDPLLLDAVRLWGDRLDLSELDMSRWVRIDKAFNRAPPDE